MQVLLPAAVRFHSLRESKMQEETTKCEENMLFDKAVHWVSCFPEDVQMRQLIQITENRCFSEFVFRCFWCR